MKREANGTATASNTAGPSGGFISAMRAVMDGPLNKAGFFRARSAIQSLIDAQNMSIPEKLFNSLIFEKELTILAADTNVGKSILAVQIADEIAKKGKKVLYIDLELSDLQFAGRYTNNHTDPYQFSTNLIRVDFDPDNYNIPEGMSYDDYFMQSLDELIGANNADVVIIDNMTALISSDTDAAKNAKPLMDRLNRLKREKGLTLLLLEHTRKTDSGRPISLNDMQGSKMKANFADAVFTIGRSTKDKNIRYIKQLKCRSAEIEYDAENVLVYEVAKEGNFLCFRFLDFGNEYDHINLPTESRTERIEKAKLLKSQGASNRAIAKEFGVTEGAVRKWLV